MIDYGEGYIQVTLQMFIFYKIIIDLKHVLKTTFKKDK